MTNATSGTVTVSRYIKIKTIADLYELSRDTSYRVTKDPSFPEPVVLPGGHYRYPAAEVAQWFESRRERPVARTKPKPATMEVRSISSTRRVK
jgi:predicted DNA-binding transcriptional regulator AlpA